MNGALVKILDPQLVRLTLKKIANQKSTALEPKLPFAQLVEKIHQEDTTRTHIDRHKISTNSNLSSSINNISMDIYNLTIYDIRTMEQNIAYGINVVQHRYSNESKFKGKPLFLKFCKLCSRSGHSLSTFPEKSYTKPNDQPNFQKQNFSQAMKIN